MRRIAILNQKGGVGKTTTAVNLAAAVSDAGCRVCLIDMDPQAHASTHLGLASAANAPSTYDILVNQRRLAEVRAQVNDRLWIVGSDINLAAAEVELAGQSGRELLLRDALRADCEQYDYVIIDCAPSLGLLTLNALAAATEVIIPLQPHFFALHGLGQLLETTALVARRINPELQVSGIVICLFEHGTRLAQEVISDLARHLDRHRNQSVPWAGARLFDSRIRRNIKLAECPSFGQSIFQYATQCPGAEDYRALAAEVMAMEANARLRRAA